MDEGGGGQKNLLSLKFLTYPTIMELATVIPCLKKDLINHLTHPLNYADTSIFSSKVSRFQETQLDVEFLETVLINMVTTSMMSAKMATLDLLKMKVFQNKCYDTIISPHDVTNNTLSCDSNYIVDLVM